MVTAIRLPNSTIDLWPLTADKRIVSSVSDWFDTFGLVIIKTISDDEIDGGSGVLTRYSVKLIMYVLDVLDLSGVFTSFSIPSCAIQQVVAAKQATRTAMILPWCSRTGLRTCRRHFPSST